MQEKERMVGESEQVAKKMRFGLFSQPLPLALGDDGQYQPKTRMFSSTQIPAIATASPPQPPGSCSQALAAQE